LNLFDIDYNQYQAMKNNTSNNIAVYEQKAREFQENYNRNNILMTSTARAGLKQGDLNAAILDMIITGGYGNYFGKERVNGKQGVENDTILEGNWVDPVDNIDY